MDRIKTRHTLTVIFAPNRKWFLLFKTEQERADFILGVIKRHPSADMHLFDSNNPYAK